MSPLNVPVLAKQLFTFRLHLVCQSLLFDSTADLIHSTAAPQPEEGNVNFEEHSKDM